MDPKRELQARTPSPDPKQAFLQHLEALLSLAHYQRLWLRALELLEQYMRFPDSELLQEGPALTLPEP